MHNPMIDVFFRPEMVPAGGDDPLNYSKSPSKPARFMEHALATPLAKYLVTRPFSPLGVDEFLVAHTRHYVDSFFTNGMLAESNGLTWSEAFAKSIRYTNGSLVAAVEHALANPAAVSFSPTSGFHHAGPRGGSGFCTMSGQVIASTLAYRRLGMRAAWIDLDGHFGNSIEDSRDFVSDLDDAIPHNLNPRGLHESYLADLRRGLAAIESDLTAGAVDYVCFAHGADSHEWDALGTQCSTAEWLEASRLVYSMLARVSSKLGRPVPLVLSLFGGYRDDDPASVLELHTADLAVCLREVCSVPVSYTPTVKAPLMAARGVR